MSTAMNVGPCTSPRIREWVGGLLPSDPFTSVRYHYGMLLGEEDFVTDQAYHRGKMRLHNAALHGAGVRWGFDVVVTDDGEGPTGEIRVLPGLAYDALGHELHIHRPWCADLPLWFDEHREDEGFTVIEDGGDRIFDAHVVVCFRACLSRPVPALVEPCEGEASDVECSRTTETVRLELRPGPAPARSNRAGHLMRIFLGLDVARESYPTARHTDAAAWARERRDELVAAPDGAAYRAIVAEACGRLSAWDTVLWGWGGDEAFPDAADPCVVLAELPATRLTPESGGDGWVLVDAVPDVSVRPSLLSTTAIQELLCAATATQVVGPLSPPDDGGEGEGSPAPAHADSEILDPAPVEEVAGVEDAGGPRIDRAGVGLDGSDVLLPFQGDPLQRSLREPGAVRIESFRSASGWDALPVDAIEADRSGGNATVRVTLGSPPPDGALRIVVRGTGPRPVLSRRGDLFVPLAGAVGDPPAGAHDGADFVHMITTRS